MAYEGQQITHSFVAGEDLSAAQYAKVFLGADGFIYDDDAAGVRKFIGVVQDNPISGVVGTVCLLGITKLKVAGATTTGSIVAGAATQTVGLILAGTSGAGVATAMISGLDTTA